MPQRTPEERREALAEALKARRARAAMKDDVTAGRRTVGQVLDEGHRGHDDHLHAGARVAGRIEVGDLVLAVKGIGPVKAAKVLDAAGIEDGSERLDELSVEQVSKLKGALGG